MMTNFKIVHSFRIEDCLNLMVKYQDEGLVEAADQWLQVAEEVHATNTNDASFENAEQMIEYSKFMISVLKKYESLCSYEKGYMNPILFKNASNKCKWVEDGNNNLIRMNIEELSPEPVVQIVHNFISAEEIHELLKKMSEYTLYAAPTTDNAYFKSRIA